MKSLCALLLGFGIVISLRADDNWYKTWTYRQMITIPAAKVTGSHAAFPVLVTEANVQPSLFANAQADGDDILFTAADGKTKIPHEIERYDADGDLLAAWVNVPAIASTADTVLYVYYGKASAANQQDAANVWTNGFVGVWHLEEASGTRADSTAAGNNASPNGTIDSTGTGKIAGAASFAGTGHLDLQVSETSLFMHTNSCTVSAWYKKGTLIGNHSIVSGESNGGLNAYRGFSLFATSSTLYGWFADGALARKQLVKSGDAANAWNLGTLVWDKDNAKIRLFHNGVSVGSLDVTGHTGWGVLIDIGAANGGQRFIGLIDEARIVKSLRSADWIATEHANQSAPETFASASDEERLPWATQLVIR